jgi:hypothetical protein
VLGVSTAVQLELYGDVRLVRTRDGSVYEWTGNEGFSGLGATNGTTLGDGTPLTKLPLVSTP